ncbi:hypothetical protein [Qipengyuania gaetbuli]|uniref:hypothetical protein n=1 Tax=Qipengyuania gaetbuli TaxID=266952 RepID=UPI001CD68B47|nr:hypothetical protein [Qipengyuania gaetbuli]MCA0910379.1 hypothetical protein [Qipengyuania gaetbuli]
MADKWRKSGNLGANKANLGMNVAKSLAAPQSGHYLGPRKASKGSCAEEVDHRRIRTQTRCLRIYLMRKIALVAAASAAALSLAACSEATEDAAEATTEAAAADAEANMEAAGEAVEAAGEEVAAEGEEAAAEVEAAVEGEEAAAE